ncbi:MAG: M23 family metallopeptidase [Chitinophagales bacterium]|nr:M23 family metallopeptidase [Chitinophagales bacterium]
MSTRSGNKGKFVTRLRSKYRLVILNDETFQESFSLRLSRANVYTLFSILLVVLTALIFALVVFTPLKEYIPGYGDVGMRRDIVKLKVRADSLEMVATQQEAWINNVKNILSDNVDTISNKDNKGLSQYDTVSLDHVPEQDLALRQEIENEENYAGMFSNPASGAVEDLLVENLFPPVKGFITNQFEPAKQHYGIDIGAKEKEAVKSVLDGTVIMADYTAETGYVIVVQHAYNLVSFYKHNSVLLKKVGNFVKAGDAIAIIGNSGEMSTGPHLHFELWKDGLPVNPETYIVF